MKHLKRPGDIEATQQANTEVNTTQFSRACDDRQDIRSHFGTTFTR